MYKRALMNGVPLDLEQFGKAGVAICAIVKLATQPTGVLQQVVLRPDKVSRGGLIRLGQTRGDEANCWIHSDCVQVVEILGRAEPLEAADPDHCDWRVMPAIPPAAEAEQG